MSRGCVEQPKATPPSPHSPDSILPKANLLLPQVSSGMLPCASWPPPAPPQLVTSITLGNPNSAPPAVYSKTLEEDDDDEESSRREKKKRRRRSRSRSREDRRSRRKRSRSKHKKHRKSRRRRSSSESSYSSEDDVRRKRKRRSPSPEVIAIRSPEVISLSPGETSPVSRVCKTTTNRRQIMKTFFSPRILHCELLL